VWWILFFIIARIGFLVSNFAEVKAAGLKLSFGSLLFGLRMDMSMAAYIVLPVSIFVMLSLFLHWFRSKTIYQVYTALVGFTILLIVFADIGLFKAWGSRIDATPLKYLANPKEVWASISNLPVTWIVVVFLIISFAFVSTSNRFIARNIKKLEQDRKKILSLLLVLVLSALFIVPLRGGLQLAPLNQSSVYFSQNNFANMAAINAPWNLMYALNHSDESSNPFLVSEGKEGRSLVDTLLASQGNTDRLVDLNKTPKPNIIIIAWESLTSKAIGLQKEGVSILPGFDSLCKEGIYFSNIYASGDRTDKGIVAILSGYPSQPTTSIVKIPSKAAKLPMLSKVFSDSNYYTSFHYGGELEFANMKAYLLQGSFKKFVSVSDFDKKDQNSKWGAHDGVVMQKLLEDLTVVPKPFFSVWLTLSSHEPYEIPGKPVLAGKEDVSQFLSSLHYTDSVVYEFIAQCRRQPWWNNTIVVIVADHGHRLLSTAKKADDFRIPLLFLGGGLAKSGLQYSRLGSQTDMAATLLAQLGYNHKSFRWSKNLLDSSAKQWAWFSFNNGFGYREPAGGVVFDNVGKLIIEKDGPSPELFLQKGRMLQQLSFQDYLDK
jgi:phosphoglycerol transferase MdoB-like AlkP superfamily enzyme